MSVYDNAQNILCGNQPGGIIYVPSEISFVDSLKKYHEMYLGFMKIAMTKEIERLKSIGLSEDECNTIIAKNMVEFTKWAESQ